ncbi:MAG: hypothetical protein ACRCUY_09015 [Thermoguttaceae bacterium]
MKTQEIIVYQIYKVTSDDPMFEVESFDEAQSYYEEGYFVQEVHIMRWEPTPRTKTSTVITLEW